MNSWFYVIAFATVVGIFSLWMLMTGSWLAIIPLGLSGLSAGGALTQYRRHKNGEDQ